MGSDVGTGRSRYTLKLKYPASWWRNKWREALPAGNGTIGAAVLGAVADETIILTHSGLWQGGRVEPVPDVSHTLPETRKLMDEGRYAEANWHLTNALKETGYRAKMAAPMPLADLVLTMGADQPFRRYQRSLDMETGEISVTWLDGDTAYARKLFVSRADGIVVCSITASRPVADVEIGLRFHPSDKPNLAEAVKEWMSTAEVRVDGEWVQYAARHEDGTDYGAVLRVITKGGQLVSTGSAIHVTACDNVLLLVKPFIRSDRTRAWAGLKQELAEVAGDYPALLERHVALHAPLFAKTNLELGDGGEEQSTEELLLAGYEGEAPTKLIETLWAYGKYLYISATAEDGLPMPLYGLWGGDYRLIWSHYMANENIQMMNWHAPVGGLAELMKPMFNHYRSLMDTFRDNARKLYGCEGIFIPAGTTPGIGVPTQIVPVILNWTGAAGWLAAHYYDYYLFTGDMDFLKEEAIPFMLEAATFYEQFLVEEADGTYRIYPSVSPENTPGNYMPPGGESLAHPMPTAINATMDIAILKELFTNLIEGCRAAGMHLDKIPGWERLLSRLPGYLLNEDGAIKEWSHPDFDDRYNHRHLSHLYPVFPGREFVREEAPEWFQAFEIAVRKRELGAQTGWSLAHMASIYARLGDGEAALQSLDVLTRSCLLSNLFTLHNDWRGMGISMNKEQAPVQLDAILGVTNAVQEMLLFVSPRLVKLMPAVPRRWEKGKAEGFRFCTGSVSFVWDRGTRRFEARIQADRPTDIRLILPQEFAPYEIHGNDAGVNPKVPKEGNSIRIRLVPGQQILIHSIWGEVKSSDRTA